MTLLFQSISVVLQSVKTLDWIWWRSRVLQRLHLHSLKIRKQARSNIKGEQSHKLLLRSLYGIYPTEVLLLALLSAHLNYFTFPTQQPRVAKIWIIFPCVISLLNVMLLMLMLKVWAAWTPGQCAVWDTGTYQSFATKTDKSIEYRQSLQTVDRVWQDYEWLQFVLFLCFF